MPETETSNYSEKIEQQFDPELIKENIEVLNTINESFSTKLSPFYLDSEHQIVAYAHRMRPKDYDRIYTIPTDADYIVFSPYGATVFKLFNTTNPEDSNSRRNYDPSYLTTTGLATITRHLIENSHNRAVITPGITQDEESKEDIFLVQGVNLPHLLPIYEKRDPFLRYIDAEDRRLQKEKVRKQQKLQKILDKLTR